MHAGGAHFRRGDLLLSWGGHALLKRSRRSVSKLGFQINAKASKLEHRSTRPATVTARNPPETKSLIRMVHLPLRIVLRIH
jgi:hypothetical protein